jgi:tetratricopeptide (TPR) repeat protein
VAVSRALVDIGRIDESAAEAQDVVDQAQALGFAPLSIEAATALGFAELSRNRVDEAERGLQAAYWSASELDHVLETQRAAELLSVLYSRKRRDVAATQTWERHAETALQRLGHPALASARLAAVRGSNRNDRGELAAAATEFAQAAATLEQLGDAWIEQRATMLNNLGEVRSRAGDHAGAESALLQARGLLQGRAGSGVSIVKVLSHLSTLRRRQGRGDEALALATEAIERLDAAYPGGHPWRAPLLNSRGAIEGDRGAYLDAIADFDAALAAASSSSAAPELAGYHANLAAAWGRLQDWPASARHARLALELMPAGDTRRTRAWLGAAQASYHLGEHVRARSELAQLDGVTLDDPALAAELDQLRGMLRPTP